MKLRIRGNSLRLRLSQGEVARLAESGRVEDEISFGASALRYSLSSGDVAEMHARYEGGSIAVIVPAARARAWAASDEVGMEREQPIPGGALRILVEKDFACVKPRTGEDDGDAFPNPAAGEDC